ncbi:SRPBCC family protein [Kitasatospora sp. NBC_01250]|uniref:SRPBCC family protein n=1 Tax=unclassified Kitasatospora TaxID=2633591 RepID=UPI002E120355|nr:MULTISPECIES: SRPBCC family protein [unclassified Kitasatospora]WSJ71298.1 SRPBCC family protein [Kitasatospora sp. NBC_01302]
MSSDPSMSADTPELAGIPGLTRVENTDQQQLVARCAELTRPEYSHQQVYGRYCTIETHVDCPPEQAYEYLRQGHHLEEWTFSLRNFAPTQTPGLWIGDDLLEQDTRIYCKVAANAEAMTVDFHCAWDQGEELWMIYLMRVVPAQLVLGRPGSVITWTNCRHPHYDRNPRPELAPRPDRPWVGDYWDLFYAGHTVELANLKAILEHRHQGGLPIGSAPRAVVR